MKIRFFTPYLFSIILLLFSCNDDDISEPVPIEPETQLAYSDYFANLNANDPVDIQHAYDGTDKMYVVTQGGIITEFFTDPSLDSSVFLNITDRVNLQGEMGLLGLAFHPDYESNGYFYVYYCPNSNESRISRFSYNPSANSGDPASELVLMTIPQEQTNHNGGQLLFGNDGYLYISSGDGGNRQNGQTLNNLKGAILRIDVDNSSPGLNYAIPADNPFINDSSAMDEIYAFGLRNPWRMSFDRPTGELWVGDVGSGRFEEINRIQSGGNYGWDDIEGSTFCYDDPCDNPDFLPPFYEYAHNGTSNAITGGYVYRGSLHPELFGKYIYADFVKGEIYALDPLTGENQLLFDTGLLIPAFGIDQYNELYFTALGDENRVYKFVREEIPVPGG
ncbi:MAG: glucose sorbosone dehydrogenase [Flavobacteriaceae bacterium]|nr:glucose sorbosone dehydrogenase [Flavobacteriaceae bacterium]